MIPLSDPRTTPCLINNFCDDSVAIYQTLSGGPVMLDITQLDEVINHLQALRRDILDRQGAIEQARKDFLIANNLLNTGDVQ